MIKLGMKLVLATSQSFQCQSTDIICCCSQILRAHKSLGANRHDELSPVDQRQSLFGF